MRRDAQSRGITREIQSPTSLCKWLLNKQLIISKQNLHFHFSLHGVNFIIRFICQRPSDLSQFLWTLTRTRIETQGRVSCSAGEKLKGAVIYLHFDHSLYGQTLEMILRFKPLEAFPFQKPRNQATWKEESWKQCKNQNFPVAARCWLANGRVGSVYLRIWHNSFK